MLRVKSMWYGENDKVSVVKKKKRKRIHGRHGSKLAQLPFPGNGVRKLVGYFKHKQKNLQAHGYRCSLHPGVFQSIDFPQGT